LLVPSTNRSSIELGRRVCSISVHTGGRPPTIRTRCTPAVAQAAAMLRSARVLFEPEQTLQ
jgi:hypothetical protein